MASLEKILATHRTKDIIFTGTQSAFMKLNEYFDRIVYLNKASRVDRNNQVQQTLKRWNIDAARFQAIEHESPRMSFNLSCMAILEEFLESKSNRLLMLEDDVQFLPEFVFVGESLRELNNYEWAMVYLGANLWNFPFKMITRRLIQIDGAWTTHAAGFSRWGAELITKQFKPVMNEWIFDDWLAKEFHPNSYLKSFMTYPMVAIQHNGHSDLMNEPIDYDICWRNTNDRIKRKLVGLKRRV